MICSACKEDKSEEEFNYRNKNKGIRHKRCKVCTRKESSKWNATLTPDERKHRLKSKKKSTYNRAKLYQLYLYKYLHENGCKTCGEKNPIVLDFDHINPSNKLFNIADSPRKQSWKKVLEEISKCQVLCANCHRIKTVKEQNNIRIMDWLVEHKFV